MSGMDYIELIRNEKADPPSGIRTLGLDGTHRWITEMERGRCVMSWPIDDRHLNLEGAVICSWTAAVADQAMFFAGMSVCDGDEVTRMADLHLQVVRDITTGPVTVTATVDSVTPEALHLTCLMHLPSGELAARTAARLDVLGS